MPRPDPSDPPPDRPAGAPAWWRPAVGLALFLAAVLLPLLRDRGRGPWLTVWAEDGDPFYQQALADGPAQLLKGYAGYLSLPPRLVSLVAVYVPIGSLAVFFAVASTLVTALLAAFVYRSSAAWVASSRVRLGLAALLVLTPAAGGEITAVTVNVIWVFLAVLPWAVVSAREGRSDVVARAAVAFLAVTSSAAGLAFAPLVVGWAVARRTRATATVAAAYSVGAAIQLFVVIASEGPAPVPGSWSGWVTVELVLSRVFATSLLGERGASSALAAHGTAAMLAATVALVLVGVLVSRRAGRRAQLTGGLFVISSLVLFAVTALGRGTQVFRIGDQVILFQHSRYSVVPSFLLASAFAVVASPVRSARPAATDRRWAGAFVIHVVILIVVGFPVTGYRSAGPTWSEALEEGRQACEQLPPDATVAVRQDQLRFWVVELPCRRLG